MAILLTGGAGYIGTHTCIELLEDGWDIVVADNFCNSKPEGLRRVQELTGRRFPVHETDLLDRRGLEEIFRRHRIEAVIHLAGLKAVGESVDFPMDYYRSNVAATLNLCEVMDKFGVRNLVFSSSATVYGNPQQVPIGEQAPLGAANPYGRSKWMIEEMLRDLHASDPHWSIAILRYFNPVGAHPSGRIGEDPNGVPNNLMPYITQVAVGKLQGLNVFGGDYDTPDGTGVRDYIHVMDLAAGHVKALRSTLLSNGAEAYNLGTGRGYSVLEMVQAFERASGRAIPYTIVERRPGDIGVCCANPAKAEQMLGWKAVRGLDEMCRDAWHWQRRNPNGYAGSVDYGFAEGGGTAYDEAHCGL